ncbi:MAG: hypothetical protein ACJATI_002730 [Halioglobus sp.]|jgi:hypothetical protein
MNTKIKAIDVKINESVEFKYIIWAWDSKWYYDDNVYEEEKTFFTKFVKMRLKVLDAEIGYNHKD